MIRNTEIETQILNPLFDNKFDIINFQNFLKETLPNIELKQDKKIISKEYKSFIDSAYDFGVYKGEETSVSKFLKVFVVKLKKSASLTSARTMQRNLIARFLEKGLISSALVAFYDDFSDDWRLSFVKVDKEFVRDKNNNLTTKPKLSPPKRFSFLVGGELNHTCKSRFFELIESPKSPTLADIEKAFSVEKVTNEFFDEYKRLFLDLKESLDEVREKDQVVDEDLRKHNIQSSDFAKKLMGQLVFIYFLQKKGWLGVEKDAQWGTGPKNFLRKIFEDSIKNEKNFFNDMLEPLFYEGFCVETNDDHYDDFGFKVPFLNGGLFEPINGYDWELTNIVLDNSIFKEILTTFDRFNFTVKEDEPLEKEVAVDPEMLGKVFENLLEVNDRKSKGAFYTPRHIVHYMCQEALINYLLNNSKISEKDLRNFIMDGDIHIDSIIRNQEEMKKYNRTFTKIKLPSSIKENSEELDVLLSKVKVADPAVGSGAFPVGMMNEIVKARYILRLLNDFKDVNMYDLKRETIENSLYGVDIELSATDVTKLRFWLSLIVDEEDMDEIKPLPNLDNQIMCGNSLIDSYENINLFDETLIKRTGQQRLMISATEQAFNELETKKTEYFKTSGPKTKTKLKKEINNLKWEFIEKQVESSNPKLIEDIQKYKSSPEKPFFVWELEFSEIFKGKNPGFDIVIANPPYVGEKGNKETFRNIKRTDWGKKFYFTKMDLFYYFYHKALDISKNNGTISFITTNYFLTADGAKKLRTDFKERASILKIINFNELRIFESAQGQHNIITFLSKSNYKDNVKCYSVKVSGDLNENIFSNILNQDNNLISYNEIPQNELYSGENNLIFLEGHSNNEENDSKENVVSNILKKMEKGVPLKQIMSINAGADITLSIIRKKQIENFKGDFIKGEGVFVLTNQELYDKQFPDNELDLIKPFIKNSDIIKFGVKNSDKHLIYTNSKTDIDKYPTIKKHLLKYKEILVDQMERYEENYPWFMIHRPREEKIFTSERIILPYRSKENNFAYSTSPLYASRDVFYLLPEDKNFDIKYILALLNSKLYYIWLYYRGKRKGDTLELYATPVGNIPIKHASLDEQKVFIDLSDNIIKFTNDLINCEDKSKKSSISKKIDSLIDELNLEVYKLYNLSPEDINIIENNF